VPCLQAGDVTDDMYQIPAVYQRIFNPLTKIVHKLADTDLFWAFWYKPLDSAGNGCKIMVGPTSNFVQFFVDHSVDLVLT